MSLVIAFDAINLISALVALIVLMIYWKRALQNNIKYLLVGLMVLMIFRGLSNVLQWSGITAALDPFEDYTEIFVPLLWGFFLYMFLQGIETRKLLDSENKFKTLLENLPQKIFLKDEKSVYVSCNENYARDLNIRPDEIVGKTDYDFYPEKFAKKYRAEDERIRESGNQGIRESGNQGKRKILKRSISLMDRTPGLTQSRYRLKIKMVILLASRAFSGIYQSANRPTKSSTCHMKCFPLWLKVWMQLFMLRT